MEQWFWLSLLSAALYGATVTLDKINLNKYFKNPLHIIPLNGFVMILLLVLLGLIIGIPKMPIDILVAAFLSGLIYLLGNIFYYKALFIEEASNISAFLRLIPVFVLILGFLFLNERLEVKEYSGIFLLILGSFGMSMGAKSEFRISKSFFLMLGASFFYASWMVIAKYLLNFSDYFTILFYGMLGLSVFSILTLLSGEYRKQINLLTKKHPFKPLFLYALATVSNLGGEVTALVALSSGFASFVSALQASQILFSMIFGIVLTLTAPYLLKEEITKAALNRKVIFIIVIVIGAYLTS